MLSNTLGYYDTILLKLAMGKHSSLIFGSIVDENEKFCKIGTRKVFPDMLSTFSISFKGNWKKHLKLTFKREGRSREHWYPLDIYGRS